MKNRFIVLEGTDGTGKSEMMKRVKELYGFNDFSLPPVEMKLIEKYVNENCSVDSANFFHLSCLIHLSDLIEAELEHSSVICHRFYPSFFVLRSYFSQSSLSDFKKVHNRYLDSLIKPDLVIYLYANVDVCKRRIQGRDKISGTDMITIESKKNAEYIQSLYNELRNEDKNWVFIDTTKQSIDETFNEVSKLVQSL